MASFKQPIQIDQMTTYGTARCRVDVSRLTAAATSQALVFNTLARGTGEAPVPANARIMSAWVNLLVPFAGGDVSACTLTLGDAGAATELITALVIFTGAALGIKPKTGALALGAFEAEYAPIITIATVDGNVAALTSGVLEVVIQYEAITTASVTS